MDITAGAQDPVAEVVQPTQPAPVEAVVTPTPDLTLPGDNGYDEDYPSPEQMARLSQAPVDFTPPAAIEPSFAAPVVPTSPQAPVPPPAAEDPERGLPGFRLKPHDAQEERIYRLLKADPTLTLQTATAFVYGQQPQAPAPVAPSLESPAPIIAVQAAPVAPPASAALKAELMELARQQQAEPWVEGIAEQLEEKRLEFTEAVTREALAERDATLARQTAVETARDQEWQGCVNRWPHLKVQGNAHSVTANALLDAWQATNDPRLEHPNLQTIVLEAAALSLIESGQWQTQQPAGNPAGHHPVAVPPTTRYNMPGAGGSPPPPARQNLTSDQLDDLMERDPQAFQQTMRQASALR
jgi:hypothetical protein